MGRTPGSFTFTAAGPATTLAFEGKNAATSYQVLALDSVRVVPLGDESIAPTPGFTLAGGNADPTGLVTDGAKFWATDRTARRVFVYAAADGQSLGDWGVRRHHRRSRPPAAGRPCGVRGRRPNHPGDVGRQVRGGRVQSAAPSDVRAVQVPGAADRLAACWYASPAFTVDVAPGAGGRAVSLYLLDYDGSNTAARVEVLDPATRAVLDSRDATGYSGGRYLTWAVTQPVRFRLTKLAGANAVLSGVFLDPLPPPPTAGAAVELPAVTGVTLDPTVSGAGDLWLVDDAGDRVHRFAGARDLTSGDAHQAADGFDLAAGNFSPQGMPTRRPGGGTTTGRTSGWRSPATTRTPSRWPPRRSVSPSPPTRPPKGRCRCRASPSRRRSPCRPPAPSPSPSRPGPT